MGYAYRALEERDLAAVYALTRAAGLNKILDEAAWTALARWSMFGSRALVAGDPPPGLIAESDGKILGFVGYSYRRYHHPEGEVGAVILSDYAVHPDARGVLGLLMNRRIIADFEGRAEPYAILGLHHTEAAGKIWERFGAKEVRGTGSTYTGLVSFERLFRTRYPTIGAVIGALRLMPLLRLARPWARSRGLVELPRPELANGLRVAPVAGLDELVELGRPLDRSKGFHEAAIVRDRAYLAWRYEAHPRARYAMFKIEVADRLAGLIVMKRAQSGVTHVYEAIADPELVTTPDDLVTAIVRAADELGASQIVTKMLSPRLAEALQRQGFQVESKTYNQYWVHPAGLASDDTTYSFGDFTSD